METMIELTCLAKSHRVIAGGADSLQIYLDLHRRGYVRVATTATCRVPCGQHDVALVAGHHSMHALEAVLVRIVHFLNSAAVLAIWVSSDEIGHSQKIRLLLQRLGFRIEAGASCERGFVLSARRRAPVHLANAA